MGLPVAAQTSKTVQKDGDAITGNASPTDVDTLRRAKATMETIAVQPKRLKGIGIGD